MDKLSTSRTVDVRARPSFLPSVVRWVASGLNSFVHFVPLLLISPFSRSAAWIIYRHWVRNTYRIFGVTFSLVDDNEGNPGQKPHLYVWLNQTSLVEGPVCSQFLPPYHYIINLGYAAMPLLGWARVLLGDIVIVRQWRTQAKRGVERATARLARGETWMISIEGERTPDGKLQPYKKGPIVMAIRSQATIIPMVFRGGLEILPRGEWRPRPGHLEVHVLRAISTRGLTYEDRGAVLAHLRKLAEQELGLAVQ